ncbi:hemerythrin domain-containing protein [Noviherbaspirillum sp. UKPF54]|uniref:hemerythrin domain-containing protein n=1 Tax=Noviherbaspirillum sp. UKPF54 TaxID=2601898 RepID=UPI0011B17F4C|nr:hemerythrin domain-containing protein [Noviherbaspirillum sp. UKPF54]QDZ28028.1 hemerythrin domain-containing protein [Noviherbaspirillum sp. UKPF54]
MNTISSYLGSDHTRCDQYFIQAETQVSNGTWDQAETSLAQFIEALEHHFAMEERVMFPEFEQATGSSAGPTAVMRMEHEQLRAISALLREALTARDADSYLGHSETLNTMMQQHNMKEESILYLMADRVLAGRQEEIIGAMTGVDATA